MPVPGLGFQAHVTSAHPTGSTLVTWADLHQSAIEAARMQFDRQET